MIRRGFAALLGAGLAVPGQAVRAARTTTLRVASNAADQVTPILYALQHGWFAQAGIDLRLTRMNNGAAVTEAVVAGSLDVGSASLLPIVIAYARGFPLALVAPGALWLTARPVSALIVPNTSRIAHAADLAGRTVGVVGLSDLTDVALRAWIARAGGDPSSVHLLEVPGSAALSALTGRRVDAMVLSVPFLGDAMASGRLRVVAYPNDAIAPRFLISAWFARRAEAPAQRAALAQFASVARRAAAATNAHPAQTLALLGSFSGMSPSRLRHMTRSVVALDLDPRDIQPVIDVAAAQRLIDRPFAAHELIAG